MNLATTLLSVLLLVMIVLALVIWARRDNLSTGRDLTSDRRAAHRERRPTVTELAELTAPDAPERVVTTRTRRSGTGRPARRVTTISTRTSRPGASRGVRHVPAATAPVTSRPATK